MQQSKESFRVGIIGVAGASVALYLSQMGLDITLFESSKSLLDGPPICHLHAGGNLYREISDSQCVQLLHESIEFMRLLPDAIDYRPTVVAVPKEDKGTPEDLLGRLDILVAEYKRIIAEDENSRCMGEPQNYYRTFTRAELEALSKLDSQQQPQSLEEWMIPFAKGVDLNRLQFPVILVQEYGINIFRVAANLSLALERSKNVRVLRERSVKSIDSSSNNFRVTYSSHTKEEEMAFDYIINAAGFKSGMIDDMLGYKRRRFVEFKAAYVTECPQFTESWPEIIFHGERGTPRGMAQFTPYPQSHFQLHGMTQEITLFEDGLVKSTERSSQPVLKHEFEKMIYSGWSTSEVKSRTKNAITYLASFIPEFEGAKVVERPLYGAQQIPGEDATLRAADVSFEGERYARCEIVKASSVVSIADKIAKHLSHIVEIEVDTKREILNSIERVEESHISSLATHLAEERGYPAALGDRCFHRA